MRSQTSLTLHLKRAHYLTGSLSTDFDDLRELEWWGGSYWLHVHLLTLITLYGTQQQENVSTWQQKCLSSGNCGWHWKELVYYSECSKWCPLLSYMLMISLQMILIFLIKFSPHRVMFTNNAMVSSLTNFQCCKIITKLNKQKQCNVSNLMCGQWLKDCQWHM